MEGKRFEELLHFFVEGELTEEQCRELNSLLADDAALANEAAERLAEHRLLGLLYQPFETTQFLESVMSSISESDAKQVDAILESVGSRQQPLRPSRIPRWGIIALAVSVLIVVTFAAQHTRRQTQTTDVPAPLATTIGTVLLSEDCQWQPSAITEGSRLVKGPLHLQSGMAVIRFDGGAELVLQDDTRLQLLSAGAVKIAHGNVVVRAEDAAAGFRVITPASEVIDLGTEFSVKVGRSGETQLNVLEGEVSVRPLDAGPEKRQVLTEGKAVVVEDAKSDPRDTEPQAERFESLLAKARPKSRADLMYAYEGFFYDEGELPLPQSTRGKGWVGPWRKRSVAEGSEEEIETNTSDALQIVHGQMNVTWPVPGGRLGMLQFPPGKTFRIRQMVRPIDLSRDGIYYFSLMVREPDLSQRRPGERPQESIRLTFRSEKDYYDEWLSFGISLRRNPRISTGPGVGFYSPAESPSDQTTLWIGKIIARENGEDEVSFRVFAESDELGYAEPAVWHVVSRNLDHSAKLNLVLLTSTGTAPRIVDELRIGPTWRSVAPMKEHQ